MAVTRESTDKVPSTPVLGLPSRTTRAARRWLLVFVAVMLAVPTAGLAGERPAPFSWHMYSGPERIETFEVDRGGDLEAVDVSAVLVRHRAEGLARRTLPAHLCASDTSITAVWVERHDVVSQTSERERRACDR